MKNHSFISAVIIIIIFAGCAEELPPKNVPDHIFSANLDIAYAYGPGINGIYFFATVINDFDETISGNALIKGTMEIEWVVPKDRLMAFTTVRTVKLTPQNIFTAHNYNAVNRTLLIDPHDTVKLGYLWDFKFDDSTDIRNVPYYRLDAKQVDCGNTVMINGVPTYVPRLIFKSASFKVKCSIQYFDRTAVIQFPEKVMSMCAINFWPDQICERWLVPGQKQTPCDLR
ncbi:MAG: hypothetical protein ACOYNS_12475, partial [Bacteroidota bacterium]